MFIKLTNARENLKGDPLYLNTSSITVIYEVANETGGSLATKVYGGPQGSEWEVEESLSMVVDLIDRAGLLIK
jgi:hypothetical protein